MPVRIFRTVSKSIIPWILNFAQHFLQADLYDEYPGRIPAVMCSLKNGLNLYLPHKVHRGIISGKKSRKADAVAIIAIMPYVFTWIIRRPGICTFNHMCQPLNLLTY